MLFSLPLISEKEMIPLIKKIANELGAVNMVIVGES